MMPYFSDGLDVFLTCFWTKTRLTKKCSYPNWHRFTEVLPKFRIGAPGGSEVPVPGCADCLGTAEKVHIHLVPRCPCSPQVRHARAGQGDAVREATAASLWHRDRSILEKPRLCGEEATKSHQEVKLRLRTGAGKIWAWMVEKAWEDLPASRGLIAATGPHLGATAGKRI